MSEHEPLLPTSDSHREMVEEAVSRYADSVTPEAVAYLRARGIDREEALTFRLGVVVDPLPEHSRFRGMLAIPYLRHDGQALAVRFRCMEKHEHRDYYHGKYNSVAGEPVRVFNVSALHRAVEEIHVCEGEFDAIVLEKVGLPAIAIPGANLWRSHHRRLLAGFSRIYVWADPDEAGAELSNKVCRGLRQARQVRLEYGDVTDTYLATGADNLLSLVGR